MAYQNMSWACIVSWTVDDTMVRDGMFVGLGLRSAMTVHNLRFYYAIIHGLLILYIGNNLSICQ